MCPDSAATETAGGIIIPDQYQSKVNEGEVLAVGPGARDKDVSRTRLRHATAAFCRA